MTRIFIISNHRMFGHGLESLLSEKTTYEIVGQEANIDQAIEQIKTSEPDVVLLDNTRTEEDAASEIIRILRTIPSIKVIGLSLQNNKFFIYRATQWVAESVDDLIDAIEIDPASFNFAALEKPGSSGQELPAE